MKIVVGIPARMGSTRFPGKPLANILGKTMLEHCYRRCALSKYTTDLFVAACDEEIKTEVLNFNGRVIMTDRNIQRPGLRVATAAEELNLDDEDIVVVVQGDEPLVHPEMIDLAIRPLIEEKDVYVSNLCAKIDKDEWMDPGEIKVVTDLSMNALFMSRAPIPSINHEEVRTDWWKQVCIMPFKWHFMKSFNHKLSPTPLELQESIEMNRAIQHGYKVRMVPSPFISKSVDTNEDRLKVEELMKSDPIFPLYSGK
ncbi:3-deoxy-manno-octulosonate cytidylyltransferase [Leptospira mtsangambouensis]|uniref:3-deoxy-manno-octulosonate cytidylyltransferase n=1 Tax=Leptospira mtsangambouensis TaxID=2484912 RepID=A0ABY2P480_9LEPT|nr:3-deoxy-manno-octulosonate cytidylyltransferase [Leptospira mtsangambouensis]TGM82268.1 3-deoxy-manno-octulosonate cytidylyltransferase [Leptospira mtsangambouensis]